MGKDRSSRCTRTSRRRSRGRRARTVLRTLFQKPPELKSPREIGLMREAGKIVAEALRLCRSMAKPGAKTIDIDQAVEALFQRHGATPLFKGYPGGSKVPFP